MGYKLTSARNDCLAASLGRALGRARPRLAAKQWVAFLAVFLLAAPSSAADEALRTDGQRVAGKLSLDDKGRLRFTPPGRDAPLPMADVTSIRFADATPPPFRVGVGHRVRFHDGQVLTGQLLGLNKETLSLRTAWAEKIEIPRTAVAALTNLPGWRTLVDDDFADGLKAWTVSGQSLVEGGGKEPRRVVLKEAGQSLTYKLAAQLEAGRAGVLFQEVDAPAGARWQLEMQFQGKGEPVSLRVTLAGNGDSYEVEVPGVEGESRQVARSSGPHLLLVQFKAKSLRVTCDDDVLWYNLDRGPGGTLRQVTLSCRKPAKPADLHGAVAFTGFALARAVDEPSRPPGEPEQDEIWLANDDQLFGRIVRADRHNVEIEGRYGTRAFAWADLRGCFFKREKALPRPVGEAAVRLAVRSGLIAEPDVLDGVLIELDDKRVTLRHALLGERVIERSRIKELRPRVPKE